MIGVTSFGSWGIDISALTNEQVRAEVRWICPHSSQPMQGECTSACWGSVTNVPSSAALSNPGQIHPEFITSLEESWRESQDVTDIKSCTFVVCVYAAKKTISSICELLTGHDVIVVSLCFCAFLMWLQPLLRAAPALKALTCACCLLAADVIVRDKYSVFVGTESLPVWRQLDLATCVSCPEEKNLCTCLCLCRLSREKKKKKKNPSGGICGVICQDEIKSSGRAEAVVPVETDYPAFIAHVGSVGRRGETCKWEWKWGRRLVWITPILFQQNIIWRLLLPLS